MCVFKSFSLFIWILWLWRSSFIACVLPGSLRVMFEISWSFVSHTLLQFALPVKTSLNITSRDLTVYLCWENILDRLLFHPVFSSLAIYSPPLLPLSFPSCPSGLKNLYSTLIFITALIEQMLGFLWVKVCSLPHCQICIQTCHLL